MAIKGKHVNIHKKLEDNTEWLDRELAVKQNFDILRRDFTFAGKNAVLYGCSLPCTPLYCQNPLPSSDLKTRKITDYYACNRGFSGLLLLTSYNEYFSSFACCGIIQGANLHMFSNGGKQ
ncbi:MAG: hypothetical protein ACYC2T_07730 [Bacillota bacterium]